MYVLAYTIFSGLMFYDLSFSWGNPKWNTVLPHISFCWAEGNNFFSQSALINKSQLTLLMFSSLPRKSPNFLQSWYITCQILHLLQGFILPKVPLCICLCWTQLCLSTSQAWLSSLLIVNQVQFVLCYTFLNMKLLSIYNLSCCFGVGIGKVM